MGKVFISGKITGDNSYMERFENAEKYLKDNGYFDIVNPALICYPLNPKTTTWDEYMQISEVLLGMCNTIFMLEGWQYSKGASIEHATARANNLKVIYETELKKLNGNHYLQSENEDTSDPYMDVVAKL